MREFLRESQWVGLDQVKCEILVIHLSRHLLYYLAFQAFEHSSHIFVVLYSWSATSFPRLHCTSGKCPKIQPSDVPTKTWIQNSATRGRN